MAKNMWIIEDAPSDTSESFLQKSQRIGTGTGIKALQNLENLASLIKRGGEFLGLQDPNKQLIQEGKIEPQQAFSDLLMQKFNLTPEYLQPQNTLESSIQRFGSQAPLAALLGGTTGLQALGLGTGAAAIPAALGAPEYVQDITQLATEIPSAIGLGIRAGKIPTIRAIQKAEYELSKGAIKPGSKASAKLIEDAIGSVSKELSTEVSEKYSTKINKALETIEQNLTKGKINPATAMDLRKKLYKLGNEVPPHIAKIYIEPLTKGINDFFAVYAAENPQFYKHLKSADKLTSLKNMKTYLDKFSNIPVVGKFAKPLSIGVKETERFIRGIATNSEARKYYFAAVKSLANNNPSLAINYLNKSVEEIPTIRKDNYWIIE